MEPAPIRSGRFARAVVFAGAAAAACDQGRGDKPDPDKPLETQAATEPVPVPRVYGRVTDQNKIPIVGAEVVLMGKTTYRTITDHRGYFALAEIAPDAYKMSIGYNNTDEGGRYARGSAERDVAVAARADRREDVTLDLRYQQLGMPYGAPPARRRVV